MQTHLRSTTVTDDAEVLTYGTEIVRCPICQTAVVAGEECPRRCRIDHRGRRQSPRRGLAHMPSGRWAEGNPFEPTGLEALALAGELRGELVA